MKRKALLLAALVAAALIILPPVGVFAGEEGAKEAEAKSAEAAPPPEKPLPPTKADLHAAITKLAVSMNKLGDSVKSLYDQRKAKDASALPDIFSKFSGDLDRMETDLASLRTTYSGMRADLDGYYRTWKAEVSAIRNDKIRKAGERRLVDFNENFDDLVKIMKEYDGELNSISSQLLDVRKYLKYDLRPAGVDQISDSLDDAGEEIDDLKDSTSKVRKTLDRLPEKIAVAGQ